MRRRFSLWICLLAMGCVSSEDFDTKADRDEVRRSLADRGLPVDEETVDPERAAEALLSAPLDPATAVKVALLLHPRVVAAYEELGIARAELVQAGLVQNPIFTGAAKFYDGGTELEYSISQSFLDVFMIPMRTRIAESRLAAVRAKVGKQIVELVHAVRNALVDVDAAQSALQCRKDARETSRSALDLVEKLHAAGNVTDLDLAVEEEKLARAELDVMSAEAHLAEMREQANSVIGLPSAAIGWTLAAGAHGPVADDFDPAKVEDLAIEKSFDLLMMKAEMEAIAEEAGIEEWSTIFPEISAAAIGTRDPDGAFGPGPEVSIGLPIFDWGDAKRAKAAAMLRRTAAEYRAASIEIRSAARRLLGRHQAVKARADFIKSTYAPIREKIVRQTVLNYNAMQIGAIEVLESRHAELDTKIAEFEHERLLRRTKNDLDELLTGSLRLDHIHTEVSLPDLPDVMEAQNGGKEKH